MNLYKQPNMSATIPSNARGLGLQSDSTTELQEEVIRLFITDVSVVEYNPNPCSQATSYSALISSFQFIVALVITRNILDMPLPVTQLLQAKNNDILDGVELIQVLTNLAMTAWNQIDYYYDL